MAARPDCELSRALKRPKTVQAGQTVAVGRVVKYGASDDEVLHAGAGEKGIGVVWKLGSLDGAAGDVVTVVLFGSTGTVPVKVGTGGATRGEYAVVVADGVTNSGTLGAGTVLKQVVGRFVQTGPAADMVGMSLESFATVSA